jgi:redox-sensitive bicupin YhaK (pirin superfamily)
MEIRKSEERGITQLDWLDSKHSFSFGDYYDPEHMRFASLRVINEDIVMPGQGFGTHPHRDMEIITYILSGQLEHQDSMGNGSIIRPGEIQRMSAGTGVLHSERNPSSNDSVHLLQIWIMPERQGLPPSYEQKQFSVEKGKWSLIGSNEPTASSVKIHQDVNLYATTIGAGEKISYHLSPGRCAWIQVAKGNVEINGSAAKGGDGLAVCDPIAMEIEAQSDAELLLFNLKKQGTTAS